MPNAKARPPSTFVQRHERAQHILARMLHGHPLREIAEAEKLTVRRVQQIVAEEIARRDANPNDDYTLLQIARLERAQEMLGRQIDEGKASAVPAFLKVIEHLGLLSRDSFWLSPPPLDRERVEMSETFEQLDIAREIVAERRGAKSNDPQVFENKRNGEIGDFAVE